MKRGDEMKNDVEIVRGTTNVFEITIKDAYGNPYNLAEGEQLLFGMKKTYADREYVFVKTVKTTATTNKDGVYSVIVTPEDTEKCDCCKYHYDVAVQSGEDFYNVIENSVIYIKKNITKWGCGC